MNPAAALESLRSLPASDRVEVMFGLWDDLAAEGWQPEPDAQLEAELERRLASHAANPGRTRTWEQVLERLRRPQ